MKNRCARCGKRIKKGGQSYRLKAELISHFDGYLQNNAGGSMAEQIARLNDEMENMSEEDIARQVYEIFEYVVCPPCRDKIAAFLNLEGAR